MSYLDLLKQSQDLTKQYESELELHKKQILQTNELFSKYGGEYLSSLIKFNDEFIKTKQ